MLKAIKDLILEFGLIGLIFGTLSVVWSKEPLSPADKIKKVVASITLSLIIGSICMGVGVNEYLTFAIIGGGCSFAREFFDVLTNLFKLLADKPLNTIKQLVDIIRGVRHDKGQDN